MSALPRLAFSSLGFGIERVGLLALRSAWATLLLALAITAAALFGAAQLRSGSTLMQLFQSDTPEYAAFERFRADFPSSDADVLIVVEGSNLFTRNTLEALRDLAVELQFAEVVAGVVSIFSVPAAPGAENRFVIPEKLPDDAGLQEIRDVLAENPLASGRLFVASRAGDATTLLVSLAPEANTRAAQPASLRALRRTVQDALAGTSLTGHLLGAPVMENEIRAAGRRDRVVFNLAGLALGIGISLAFFGRWRPVVIASAPPVVALVWTLGIFGLVEGETNTIMNAVLPLVLAITFADSMHLVFAVRRRLRAGDVIEQAVRTAVLNVGPACVMTSLTTALALSTLLIADSDVINAFGRSAALAVLAALLAVLLLVPAISLLMLRGERAEGGKGDTRKRAEMLLDGAAARLARFVRRHARAITLATVAITIACAALHLQLRPTFQLSAQVPDGVRAAMDSVQQLGIAQTSPVQIVLRLPAGETIHGARGREALRAAHDTLAAHPDVRSVSSLDLVHRWLAELPSASADAEEYFNRLPVHLQRRLVNEHNNAALITGFLPDLNADATLAILAEIEESLAPLRDAHPDLQFTVTGLPALAAASSTRMIGQLNTGLLTAIVLISILLGLGFASWLAPLVSILPNLLPLVVTGAAIWLIAGGLDYTSVIALTVAFGLAVDNTIHYLNALRLERARTSDLASAVTGAIEHVGPVIVVTTAVLVMGIGTTVVSDLPPSRIFGLLCVGTLATALAADLLSLPASILALGRDLFAPQAS